MLQTIKSERTEPTLQSFNVLPIWCIVGERNKQEENRIGRNSRSLLLETPYVDSKQVTDSKVKMKDDSVYDESEQPAQGAFIACYHPYRYKYNIHV